MRQVADRQTEGQEGRDAVDAAAPATPRMPSWLHRRMKALDRVERRLPAARRPAADGAPVRRHRRGRHHRRRPDAGTRRIAQQCRRPRGRERQDHRPDGNLRGRGARQLQLPPDASLPAIDVASARACIETLPWVQAAIAAQGLSVDAEDHDRRAPALCAAGSTASRCRCSTIPAASSAMPATRIATSSASSAQAPRSALPRRWRSPTLRRRSVRASRRRPGRRAALELRARQRRHADAAAGRSRRRHSARIASFDQSDDLLDRDIVSVDLRARRPHVRAVCRRDAAAKRDAYLKEQAKLAKRKGAST